MGLRDPSSELAIGSRLAIGSICGGISVTVSPPDLVVDLFNFPVVEALGSF